MSRKTVRSVSVSLMLTALAGSTPMAHASVQYGVTNLGTLNSDLTEPFAINNAGQITGYSVSGSETVYRWDEANGMQALWSSSSLPYSTGAAINDGGVVAGAVGQNFATNTPVTWSSSNALTVLAPLSGAATNSFRQALGINNAGTTVGLAANTAGVNKIARWAANGSVTEISGFAANRNSVARDINNNDQIVGNSILSTMFVQHGFIYSNGVLTDLASPFGGSRSDAMAINDSGQVVGWGHDVDNNQLGFVWQNGAYTPIGTFAGFDDSSLPAGINASGQVVGRVGGNANLGHAFYWDTVSGIVDLNTLIDPSLGITLKDARGINDSGWIIAWGIFDGTNPSTDRRAFLLRPVPSSQGLAVLALGGIAASRRRRGASAEANG